MKIFKRKNDQQIFETWAPFVKKYGIDEKRPELQQWVCEYAHEHACFDNSGSAAMFESVTPGLFFQKPGSISYMGQPVAPTPSQFPVAGQQGFGHANNAGSGDKFPSLLPISIQVAAKTIAFDLVSIITMDAPVGFIPYLDYVYAGGRTDTEFPPFLIKLSMFDPTSASVASPHVRMSTVLTGANFSVLSAGPVTELTLKFVGFSRVDGAACFRVISLTAATINAAFLNGNTLVNTDTGDVYAITGANNLVELVSALENHISGFTSTDEATMGAQNWSGNYLPEMSNGRMNIPGSMTRNVAENAPFRQMGMKMFTKFVEAEGDQVAISATIEQIQDFNRVWNFDVISMLENVASNDIAQSINKRLTGRLFELGYIHKQEIDKVEGTGITTLSLSASGGFENTTTLQRRVVTKVLEMANLIYHRGRWGAGEYIVTNGRVAAALADVSGYSIAPAPIKASGAAGQLYPAGTVYGMQVYVDPNLKWGDNKILIGRKGKEEEPGLKFMPYIMAESFQTISEGTMSPKIGVKSRYAVTEAGWHPETQYILMQVSGIEKIVAGANPIDATWTA